MNYKSEEWLAKIRKSAEAVHRNRRLERIEEYNKNPKRCAFCGAPLEYDKRFNKFCNHSCNAKFLNYKRHGWINNGEPVKFCKECGNPIYAKKGRPVNSVSDFCSADCKVKYMQDKFVKEWKEGKIAVNSVRGEIHPRIRRYLFEKYGNKCQLCGWGEVNKYTGMVPLEVHHIDGNYLNNNEDNLQLLCPCCHSLTSNYGSRNKGKGRKKS